MSITPWNRTEPPTIYPHILAQNFSWLPKMGVLNTTPVTIAKNFVTIGNMSIAVSMCETWLDEVMGI
jgi:hypothetical protein